MPGVRSPIEYRSIALAASSRLGSRYSVSDQKNFASGNAPFVEPERVRPVADELVAVGVQAAAAVHGFFGDLAVDPHLGGDGTREVVVTQLLTRAEDAD